MMKGAAKGGAWGAPAKGCACKGGGFAKGAGVAKGSTFTQGAAAPFTKGGASFQAAPAKGGFAKGCAPAAKGSFSAGPAGKGAMAANGFSKGAPAGCAKGAATFGKGCKGGKDGWTKGYDDGKGGGKFGKDAKGKGKFGKDAKGKGKSKGPSGPNLPRTRISEASITGEVVEWKGKYGWIQPSEPVEHPMAAKHQGRIFASVSDLVGGITELTPGSLCQFQVFTDASGLGAEEIIGA
jgi:hypothetical protein